MTTTEMQELTTEQWSEVLVQSLPYFKQWCGKVVVVKYGGNAMLNEELKEAVMDDIVLLSTIGIKVVLVHGGGPEINHMLDRVGKESKFVDGLRYTDGETMEIVQMVLTGKLNKDIVGILLQKGGKAVGLSGVDAGTEVLRGFIPVVSTVALGEQGDDARYNINADTAAAKIAVALKAEKFVQLTNVPGILRNIDDPTSLIKRIERTAIGSLKATGVIAGGMIPKIDCCETALNGGVPRTHIIDGRVPHSLLIEMFSDRGIGTMVY